MSEIDKRYRKVLDRVAELEKQLAERDLVLHTILEGTFAGYWDWFIQDDYEYLSPSFKQMFGYADEELPNHPDSWQKIIHPDDLPGVFECFEAHVQSKGELPFDNTVRYYHKDGAIIWVSCKGRVVEWDEQDRPLRMIGCHVDITKRKMAEQALRASHEELEARVEQRTAELRERDEQLRQSQKMEAIGQLAGGVAHDFNNLLSVILGYSEIALDKLDESHALYKALNRIQKAGEGASSLTQQLLAYSRRQVLEPRVLNPNEVIKALLPMMERLIEEDIEVVIRLDPKTNNTLIDPGQLNQILMNLIVNARDAMHGGGTLCIETANVYLDEDYVLRHQGVQPGAHVMIAVGDTGGGMDAETQARIFEPFFTTKERGRGTGLGLSTVYGIVKQSGGNIWIYSELGIGTTFKIYLPQCVKEQDVSPKPCKKLPRRGHEVILVAEDDEDMRELFCEVLESAGYKVLSGLGLGALNVGLNYSGKISLLLTDVVMPKISGKDLAQKLLKQRPDLEVIYMSGYSDNIITEHRMLEAGITFLEKPLIPSVLLAKIREVLDQDLYL